MIDIHTHILYDTDDGAKTLEDSIKILTNAAKNNVTDIVLTPHYIRNTKYNLSIKEKTKRLNNLQKELKKRGININLYLGNEVLIEKDLISLYKEISTINNSRYILIEFPLNQKNIYLDELLEEINSLKLVPIIAHPERYLSYYKDYNLFIKLHEKGCLFQGNISSLYNKFGSKSNRMLKDLLKLNLIDIMASDIHSPKNNIYKKNINRKLVKIIKDQNKVNDLLVNNPTKVIKNIKIN